MLVVLSTLALAASTSGPVAASWTSRTIHQVRQRQLADADVADWFAPIKNGINLDVARPSSGVWFKWQYDKSQMQAIVEAGFASVRIFMPYAAKLEETQEQIEDALDAGLSIVVCMWGLNDWASNVAKGEREIANGGSNGEGWGPLALAWKGFSNRLVFEVLNEPEGIGFAKTSAGNTNAMKMYNAAVQAIRNADPDRPILVGSPGLNDAELLEYVTRQSLPYTFVDGGHFHNDPNMGVAIHFYEPRHPSIVPGITNAQQTNFAMWIGSLTQADSEWRDGIKVWQAPIKLQFDFVDDWRNIVGHSNIPVATTEWGCWMWESRSQSDDFRRWLDYTMEQFAAHDVGQMWYVGVMSNQYAYTIFDSETGWDAAILPKLTGEQPPTSWPPINQILNGEFLRTSWSDATQALPWVATGVQMVIIDDCRAAFGTYDCGDAGFSGSTMLKLQGTGGQLSIQTYPAGDGTTGSPPFEGIYGPQGRTMLHLTQGASYSLRFLAGSSAGSQGVVRARLKAAGGALIHQFNAITVSGPPTASHQLSYTHSAADVMDVRLEFDFGAAQQVIYLDKVELIRQAGSDLSPSTAPSPPPFATPSLPPSPECKPFCEEKTQGWDAKCTWGGCNGCTECLTSSPSAPPPTPPPPTDPTSPSAPPPTPPPPTPPPPSPPAVCKPFCEDKTQAWDDKCTWGGCNGCTEC